MKEIQNDFNNKVKYPRRDEREGAWAEPKNSAGEDNGNE
jgi:hypothetical protein